MSSCNLSQHSIFQAQAFYPWICPISVCTAIFQGFVTGQICQQQCGRSIEKEQCALSPLFPCNLPVILTNGQTPMLRVISLIPTTNEQIESHCEVQPTLSTGSRQRGGEESRHSTTVPWNLQPNKGSLGLAVGKSSCAWSSPENYFTTQKCCLGKMHMYEGIFILEDPRPLASQWKHICVPSYLISLHTTAWGLLVHKLISCTSPMHDSSSSWQYHLMALKLYISCTFKLKIL